MLQIVFGIMMGAGLLFGLVQGKGTEVVSAMLSGAGDAVLTVLSMAGGFAFFCGLMGILERAGGMQALARLWRPLLRRLTGGEAGEEAMAYMAMNLSANMLGMGNAATPMGLEAARRLGGKPRAGNALCLFLVMNAASIEILPTSVISLRAAAGSANPGAITLPTLLVTVLSAFFGILSCKIMEKKAC